MCSPLPLTFYCRWDTLSSISIDGRIYFKGGAGQCAWPDLVTVKARTDDQSEAADSLRSHAANTAAHRRRPTSFSMAKTEALSDYAVTDTPTTTEIDEFERVISLAEDERPIQHFLENHQPGRRYCQVDEKLVDLPPRYWARSRREPAMPGIRNGRQPQLDNTLRVNKGVIWSRQNGNLS